MDKLPLIEAEALRSLSNIESFQDDLFVVELDSSLLPDKHNQAKAATPLRMNAFLIVITLQGSSEFSLDYVPYEVPAGQLTTIFPTHTILLKNLSPDFKAKMVVLSKEFLEGWLEKRTPSMLNYFKLSKNPFTPLNDKETELLLSITDAIQNKIKDRIHFFQKEILQIKVIELLIELGNIFMGKKGGIATQAFTRKEELLNQFLELLFIHCKEEHQVAFYADRLCISPQYLSLILKERTGKSASRWIDEALMTEAKILLKSPNTTVQQVANSLNFSDQSTFGKFFKKHQKMSPLEYRKS